MPKKEISRNIKDTRDRLFRRVAKKMRRLASMKLEWIGSMRIGGSKRQLVHFAPTACSDVTLMRMPSVMRTPFTATFSPSWLAG
jgi:hypothetical protein